MVKSWFKVKRAVLVGPTKSASDHPPRRLAGDVDSQNRTFRTPLCAANARAVLAHFWALHTTLFWFWVGWKGENEQKNRNGYINRPTTCAGLLFIYFSRSDSLVSNSTTRLVMRIIRVEILMDECSNWCWSMFFAKRFQKSSKSLEKETNPSISQRVLSVSPIALQS